jgi:hypothetical protein
LIYGRKRIGCATGGAMRSSSISAMFKEKGIIGPFFFNGKNIFEKEERKP